MGCVSRTNAAPLAALLAVLATTPLNAQELEIKGRVLDSHGEPLAKATVELRPQVDLYVAADFQWGGSPRPTAAATASDRDGRFVLRAPEPGFWDVVVRAAGHLPAVRSLRPLISDEDLPEIALIPAEVQRIRIVDADGQPRVGVRLQVHSLSERWQDALTADWRPDFFSARTDANGTVTVPGESGGQLTVTGSDGTLCLDVNRMDAPLDLELRLTEPMVPGWLVDATGRPAPEVVLANEKRFVWGISDEDGTLLLPPLGPPGRNVNPFWAADATGPFSSGVTAKKDDGVVVQLPDLVTIDGRVVDDSAAGISGALVWKGAVVWVETTARSDANGSFRLRLGRRNAVLHAAAPGFVLLDPVSVPLTRLEAGDEVVIAMQPTYTVHGRTVDRDGTAVTGVGIEATPVRQVRRGPDGSTKNSSRPAHVRARLATSDDDGVFELSDLVPDCRKPRG